MTGRTGRRPITAAEIEAGRSPNGGFAQARLRAWGVRCPPKAGWRRRLLRTGVPSACPYPDGFVPSADADGAVAVNPLLAFRSSTPVELPVDAVEIFADGSCRCRAGGWGFAVYRGGKELHSACGGEPDTTNNRMELAAVIAALRWLDRRQAAIVRTDSQYAVRGIVEWRHGWEKANWRRRDEGEVANADLWPTLFALLDARPVDVRWVRGHAETAGNGRADELATLGRRRTTVSAS